MPGFMQQNDVIIGLVLVSHWPNISQRQVFIPNSVASKNRHLTVWWMWMMMVDTFLCVSELGL